MKLFFAAIVIVSSLLCLNVRGDEVHIYRGIDKEVSSQANADSAMIFGGGLILIVDVTTGQFVTVIYSLDKKAKSDGSITYVQDPASGVGPATGKYAHESRFSYSTDNSGNFTFVKLRSVGTLKKRAISSTVSKLLASTLVFSYDYLASTYRSETSATVVFDSKLTAASNNSNGNLNTAIGVVNKWLVDHDYKN